MRPLPKVLILLPILVTGLGAAMARAETVAAAQAVEILARARVLDSRCHFLSTSLHQELARYAARAEIAAASQLSASTASAAVAAGEAEGRKGACDDTGRSDVTETLAAARAAVKAADAGAPTEPEPQDTTASVMPKGLVGGLGYYGGQVKAYYVERKCKHLSANQDDRYWRAIGRIHQATVAKNGAPAVAPVMRRAEAAAADLSCGAASLQMVKAGFAEATRN